MSGDLSAVTVPLPGPPGNVGGGDPIDVAGEDGLLFADDRCQLAGRGTAAELALPGGLDDEKGRAEVRRWLAALPHHRPTGAPALRAFAALPFDRTGPGSFVVPATTVTAGPGGRRWLTAVGHDLDPGADPARWAAERLGGAPAKQLDPAPVGDDDPPQQPVLVPEPAPEGYAAAVARALAAIAAGRIHKVVLARRLDACFDRPLATAPFLRRLREEEPSSTTFAIPLAGGGRFVGLSPELLIERRGAQVRSQPLAGTVGRGRPELDEEAITDFLRSDKDRLEHQLVVEAVANALRPSCRQLEVPATPSLVRLRWVAHLGTPIAGTLRPGHRPSALDLVAALHPTPAVGGTPRRGALELIDELEPASRGHWAGPVGWVDADGDGQWVIGIRSATVEGRRARLWAGAGIVAGSRPRAELDETTAKLAPVLDALVPGLSP